MIALTKKTDYALIALAHLASCDEDLVSARSISEGAGLRLPVLTNVLKSLSAAGIVNSVRGAAGGYGLAKPMASITLHELLMAVEGPVQFVRCIGDDHESGGNGCDLEPSCPVRSPALKVHERLRQFLDGVTLDELAVSDDAECGCQTTDEADRASVRWHELNTDAVGTATKMRAEFAQ